MKKLICAIALALTVYSCQAAIAQPEGKSHAKSGQTVKQGGKTGKNLNGAHSKSASAKKKTLKTASKNRQHPAKSSRSSKSKAPGSPAHRPSGQVQSAAA